MAGENYPVNGVPDVGRYERGMDGRYGELHGRGDAGTFRTLPATLEEEAQAGGWLPNSTPTGEGNLKRLMTIGMRGEPDFDDDPVPSPRGGYADGDRD